MKSIVLDRDGVINFDSDEYIKSEDEWREIPGSIDSIARLSKAGFNVYVATNQSGLARNLFSEFDLARMHQKMLNLVSESGGKVEGIVYCPHLPEENCGCRKPKTGMLEEIEKEFDCSLEDAYFVGDSIKDVEAAFNHGCIPILVRTGKGRISEKRLLEEQRLDILIFNDLTAFVNHIFEITNA